MRTFVLFLLLTGCHDHIMPVKPCGKVTYIQETFFEVDFNYVQDNRFPPVVTLRFLTNRPDTVRFGQKVCIK
jgi:hypothetical protein